MIILKVTKKKQGFARSEIQLFRKTTPFLGLSKAQANNASFS